MKLETLALIIENFEFIGSHKEFNPKELAYCLNAYLFALAQHGVIDSDEYKELGNIVTKAFVGKEVE